MRKQKDSINNFDEVFLGFNEEEAKKEASRCLKCPTAPCIKACPVGIKMNEYMQSIQDGKFEKAYCKILEDNFFPSVCGRVCPQEHLCEKACVLNVKNQPIAIGAIEAFIGDKFLGFCKLQEKKKGKKVAIVGSGPSSLSVAFELSFKGYDVTIMEALHEIGGVLMYGIPNFRLDKKLMKGIKQRLEKLGIKVMTNMVIGRTIDMDDLEEEYDAIFLGVGAGLPYFLNIEGENLNGVYSANEFLTRINLMKAYSEEYDTPVLHPKKCIVVGGGNVAMDSARCARRLGSSVTIVYRRSEEELPARKEEILNAKEEGVEFSLLSNPIKINGEGKVKSIECVKMELGKKDASGRKKPVVIPNSNFIIDCDCIIVAIGQGPNPLLLDQLDIEKDKKGYIMATNYATSNEKIFAGGDIISGSATVIKAIADGKKSAAKIDEFLR